MVRSRWIVPVVVVLAAAGLGRGQSSPVINTDVGGGQERFINVQEMNKPAKKCKVLKTWSEADGSKGSVVQVVDGGEMLTVVESHRTGEGDPSGAGNRMTTSTRIFHWGMSQSPPHGSPVPPATATVYAEPMASKNAAATEKKSSQGWSLFGWRRTPTEKAVSEKATPEKTSTVKNSADAPATTPIQPSAVAPTTTAAAASMSPTTPIATRWPAAPATADPKADWRQSWGKQEGTSQSGAGHSDVARTQAVQIEMAPPAKIETAPPVKTTEVSRGASGKVDPLTQPELFSRTPAFEKPAKKAVETVTVRKEPEAVVTASLPSSLPTGAVALAAAGTPPAPTGAVAPPAPTPLSIEVAPSTAHKEIEVVIPVLPPTDSPVPVPVMKPTVLPPVMEQPPASRSLSAGPAPVAATPAPGGIDGVEAARQAVIEATRRGAAAAISSSEEEGNAFSGPVRRVQATAPGDAAAKPAADPKQAAATSPPAAPRYPPPPVLYRPIVPQDVGLPTGLANAFTKADNPRPIPADFGPPDVGGNAFGAAYQPIMAPVAPPGYRPGMGYVPPPQQPGAPAQPATPFTAPAAPSTGNGETVPEQLSMLRDALYPSQREWAADRLSANNWRAEPQVVQALLTSARQDPAPMVRAMCVRALAKMKAGSPEVVAAVQSLKGDGDPRVRTEVEQAVFTLTGARPVGK